MEFGTAAGIQIGSLIWSGALQCMCVKYLVAVPTMNDNIVIITWSEEGLKRTNN